MSNVRQRKGDGQSGRKAPADVVGQHSDEITTYMNTNQPDAVQMYARFFGQCPSACRAKMTEIDSEGFTVSYKEDPSADAQEVRVQFRNRLTSREQTREATTALAVEAARGLGLKSYNPGPMTTNKDVNLYPMPNLQASMSIAAVWFIFVVFSCAPLSVQLIPLSADAQLLMQRGFLVLLFVHMVESMAVLGVCSLFGGMPADASWIQAGLVLIFGVFHWRKAIFAATKYREKRLWNVGLGSYQVSKEEVEELAKEEELDDKYFEREARIKQKK
ncbi:hypothetical protein BJ742DRAFT_252155 [Cladochytrium replicatum]|nr:hypothetical protein BJ742DRAFT_252155 [Cladochytrium replicatum]